MYIYRNYKLNNSKSHITSAARTESFPFSKIRDYLILVKVRLTGVVVFSSVLGYLIAAQAAWSGQDLLFLVAGGFLVAGAANALNQVLEKDFDTLMTRTAQRPVATGRMKSSEGVMFAGLSLLLGVVFLATFNTMTAFLGMVSFILYAFVYTPLKRYSTLAVPVGAIPGSLPVMIGFTAFEGSITILALCLFIIQFLWQFPHFWAIGFLGFDDYKKAGYRLLPSVNGKVDRNLGYSSMFYAFLILPVLFIMYLRLDASAWAIAITFVLTLIYVYLGHILQRDFNRQSALKLMFFSFIYLPLVLITFWLI